MYKKGLISLLFTCVVMVAFSQDDPKAKAILDELSKKTKAYTSIKSDFTITMQPIDKTKKAEIQNASVLVKGEKYKLNIKGQEIICDGKTTWTYLKDANEVQINNVDNSSEDGLNPSKIFTIYEKGYKYKFEKEETQGVKIIQLINLYPANPDKAKFHTAKLSVDKADKKIVSMKMMMKDGSSVLYALKTFETNQPVTDASFTFDAKAHPGVEVVDLRD